MNLYNTNIGVNVCVGAYDLLDSRQNQIRIEAKHPLLPTIVIFLNNNDDNQRFADKSKVESEWLYDALSTYKKCTVWASDLADVERWMEYLGDNQSIVSLELDIAIYRDQLRNLDSQLRSLNEERESCFSTLNYLGGLLEKTVERPLVEIRAEGD